MGIKEGPKTRNGKLFKRFDVEGNNTTPEEAFRYQLLPGEEVLASFNVHVVKNSPKTCLQRLINLLLIIATVGLILLLRWLRRVCCKCCAEFYDDQSRMVITSYGRVLFWTTDLSGMQACCVKQYSSVSHVVSHSLDLLHSSHVHYYRGKTCDCPCITGACCFTRRWRASLRLSFGSRYAPAAISTFNTAAAGFNSTVKPTSNPVHSLDTYWNTGFVAIAGCIQRYFGACRKFANNALQMQQPDFAMGYAGTPFTVEIETGGSPFSTDSFHQKERIYQDLFDVQQQILAFRARFCGKKGKPLTPSLMAAGSAGAEEKVAEAVGAAHFPEPKTNNTPRQDLHSGEYFTVDMEDQPLTEGHRVHVDMQLFPLLQGERVVDAITSEPTGSFSCLQRFLPCCFKRREYGAIVFTTHRIANIFTLGRGKNAGAKFGFAVDAYFIDDIKSGMSTQMPMEARRSKNNAQNFVNRQAYLHTKYGFLEIAPSPQFGTNCCGCPMGQTLNDDQRAEAVLVALTRLHTKAFLPPPKVPETSELVNDVTRLIPLLPGEVPVLALRSRPPEKLCCYTLCQDGPLLCAAHLGEALCGTPPENIQRFVVTTHRVIGYANIVPGKDCLQKLCKCCSSSAGSFALFWAPLSSMDPQAVRLSSGVHVNHSCADRVCPCCYAPEHADASLQLGLKGVFPVRILRQTLRPETGLAGESDFAQFQRVFGIVQARRILNKDSDDTSTLTTDDMDLSRAVPMDNTAAAPVVAQTGADKNDNNGFVQVGPKVPPAAEDNVQWGA